MEINYLRDTNTAIYFLQDQFPKQAAEFIDRILVDEQPAISVISEMELLCWDSTDFNDWKILNGFIRNAVIIDLEQEVKHMAISIRRVYKTKLPDAIIAATAIAYKSTLITHNQTDFKKIKGLTLIDPFEMEDD
jgi:predicted nucleic acid-binding protein